MHLFHVSRKALFASCFVLISMFCVQCQPQQKQETTTETSAINLQDQSILATLFVQQSAEYRAICMQTYHLAKVRLDQLLSTDPIDKPAVVLDIDETVLNNSPYAGWQIKQGQPYSWSTWKMWTDLAEADSVPGSLGFLRFADWKGVQIFYVSNRKVAELEATMKNLEQLGYPQVEKEHFMLKETSSSKAERRAVIREQGYHILLLFGDNLADLNKRFEKQPYEVRQHLVDSLCARFGEEYFVLPSPTYGDWETSLYNYDYSLSDAQIDSIRRSYLKGF